MNRKHFFVTVLIIISILVLGTGLVLAQDQVGSPLNAAFTYQGHLNSSGTPYTGLCDFQFGLWDADTAGTLVGSTLTVTNVGLNNGLFTVVLDWGLDKFQGEARWLEVYVRCPAGSGTFTILSPRQALTSTPYALYALTAPWSGLSSVPAGFADGTDDGASYQNVIVVAKSGGNFTTITAALNSITDASSDNRYLVYVAPGVYTESVTMKQYVDIEGAGELTTRITYTGSTSDNTGTVVGVSDAELRFLTVENTGGSMYAVAIYNGSNASPRLTDLTAIASGGTSYTHGVVNYYAFPTMKDVTASVSGGTENYGVYNYGSWPMMKDVTITVSGSWGSYNYGVYNYGSWPTMTDVTIIVSGSGGTESHGVYNYYYSEPTMTNVSASASGATYNYGVYINTSWSTMTNVSASASGGLDNFGLYSYNYGGSYTVLINNSQISGSTNTIYSDSGYVVRIGASQLSGGDITGGGTVSCVGVYDEDYNSPGYLICP